MSLLSDALLAGTNARLHLKTDDHSTHKPVRKSQAHGFLTPLAKLVRDPVHTLGNAIASPCDTKLHPVAEEVTNHKQILYLRLKNVGAPTSGATFTC
jgi:TAG lipase/steryl ester hydrolase/phospholipase A2/LPA acyltransferase